MTTQTVIQFDGKAGRNFQIDNIRFILMAITIFAHFMECFSDYTTNTVYRGILSFHMPAFIFLTGYFAHFSRGKILMRFAIPYTFFQVIYILFDHWLNPDAELKLQLTTPFWLMWYLLATLIYYLLIPVIDVRDKKKQALIVLIGTVVSLLIGYDETIGGYLSLSRVIVFLPFFLVGFYIDKTNHERESLIDDVRVRVGLLICIVVLIILLEVYFVKEKIPSNAFYCSRSYKITGTGPIVRGGMLICSWLWILLLLIVVPNKKIPIISNMGKDTMKAYLFHGFVKMFIEHFHILHYSESINVFLSIGGVAAIMILSNVRLKIKSN